MGMQMYLVQPEDHHNDQARETIAEFIAQRQGFILMATSNGSLIVAFDDSYVDAVKAHPVVKFVGGVTLSPDGPAAMALQRMFAQNVALQLNDRGMVSQGSDTRFPDSASFPLGYRPLRWSRGYEEERR